MAGGGRFLAAGVPVSPAAGVFGALPRGRLRMSSPAFRLLTRLVGWFVRVPMSDGPGVLITLHLGRFYP
ncbi:hypothetical protein ADK33_03775 [Streptomyces griseus subsp. rhodochrous]|nr:hypothetical protein ADK33_03775 [Streptomyces griseus subsp. rhodochrous]